MALLEKAKKSSEEKDDKKKKPKHKHPAAKPSQPEEVASDAGADEAEGSNQEQPDTGADDAGPESAPESGELPGGAPDQGEQQGGNENQEAAQGGDSQQGGDQSGQGAPPVPSPAAPGAGDTTSGGEDTPVAGQDQDPNAQPPETPGEDTAAGPGSTSDLQQIPMSPGLKDEYDKANELLMQLLYKAGDDKLATGLVQGLMPQGPGKIKNTVMLSLTVLTQIHKRLQLPAQIILPFAKDITAHVLDLGQQVKQIQYSDQEATAVLGAVYEGALRIFGVSKEQVKKLAHHFGRNVLESHQQKYLAAHAHAKPAIDANNAAWNHSHLAPQQGAPQDAGPQTGAPVGSQSAPTSGAPPQPPVPAATPEQGMLSQAAQEGAQ